MMTDQTMQQPLPGIGRYDDNNHAGVTPSNTKDKRRRVQFKFWLDANKSHESKWGRALDEMKGHRKYSQFIRDAIRLLLSLLAGELDELMELFPDIVQRIRDDAIAEYSQARAASADFEALIRDFADHIDDRLDAVQAAVATAPKTPLPGLQPVMGQMGNSAGIRPLANVTAVAAPVYDDDEIELVVTGAVGDGSANGNFIRSMMALQGS